MKRATLLLTHIAAVIGLVIAVSDWEAGVILLLAAIVFSIWNLTETVEKSK